jgi:hypothetical protein
VDTGSKEVRFAVKDNDKFDIEQVKKTIKDIGFTVSAVKSTPKK